jgi:hypothetical protein
MHLAWAVVGLLRLYLDLDGRPHEARLVQDLLVAAIYLGVGLAVLSFVFGIAIGTLLATSGVIAIILGLALQSTLNDVFSGLALTLGRPYAIGDWILLADGTEGRVVENTWRSTQILTPANNIVVLPNSYLAKIGLTNVSRPNETHQMTLKIRIRAVRNPSVIVDILQQALLGANVIIHDPPPVIVLQGIDSVALGVDINFNVRHIADLIHRQCRAEDVMLALPASNYLLAGEAVAGSDKAASVRDLIQINPAFSRLSANDLEALTTSAVKRNFEPGDRLLHNADALPVVRILSRGIATMEYPGAEPIRLAAGDILGQVVVNEEAPSFAALTNVDVFELDSGKLTAIFGANPELLRDLSHRLTSSPGSVNSITSRQAHERWHATAFIRAIESVFRRR